MTDARRSGGDWPLECGEGRRAMTTTRTPRVMSVWDDGGLVGMQRDYPTKTAFVAAVNVELGTTEGRRQIIDALCRWCVGSSCQEDPPGQHWHWADAPGGGVWRAWRYVP